MLLLRNRLVAMFASIRRSCAGLDARRGLSSVLACLLLLSPASGQMPGIQPRRLVEGVHSSSGEKNVLPSRLLQQSHQRGRLQRQADTFQLP